jgi:hypothetical protein
LLKRILYGSGAVGALGTAYLVGSLTLGGAFAQTAPAPSPSTTAPAAAAEKADSANEASEAAALASQAKISVDQARAAALAKFPGATVGKIDLDNENGVVAYSVELTDTSGKKQDVSIDATNGSVLAAQAEGAETPGAPEGPETGD